MVVRVNESRVDCATGLNRNDTRCSCRRAFRGTPNCFNHAVANQYSPIFDDVALGDHSHYAPLKDVLPTVDMILRRVAVALQVVGTPPFLVVGYSRSRTTVRQLGPVSAGVVAVGDIPIRVFALVTDGTNLDSRAVDKTNCVSIPEVELDSCPRSVEYDVGTRFDDGSPPDTACRGATICDVI